jgi:hypothetical protein
VGPNLIWLQSLKKKLGCRHTQREDHREEKSVTSKPRREVLEETKLDLGFSASTIVRE